MIATGKATESGKKYPLLVARGLLLYLLIVAFLFIIAGRLDYWQGWVHSGLGLFFFILTLFLLRKNPELAMERQKPGRGMMRWDKVYFLTSTAFFFGAFILAALDAGRFGWSGRLPAWLYIASIALYAVGQALFVWAKVVNKFFSSVVRIQTERGHVVCQEGPYRFVRHPGYTGGFLYSIAMPFVLGSLWAVIPQYLGIIALMVRTELEDRFLQKALPGYAEYAKKVRHKLIPGIW